MNNQQKYQLLKKAKQELINNPYDEGHEITHHYKVWDNCVHISLDIDLDGIDLDILEIATWWHDIDREDSTHPRFIRECRELGVEKTVMDKIISIINAHTFSGERSEVIEAKILFDADKIEYINPVRWLWIDQVIRNGDMDLKQGLKYCRDLIERFGYVRENLNYEYTKKLFEYYTDETVKLIENQKLSIEFINAIDLSVLKG